MTYEAGLEKSFCYIRIIQLLQKVKLAKGHRGHLSAEASGY